jgi:hypothetical protein
MIDDEISAISRQVDTATSTSFTASFKSNIISSKS